MDLWIRSQDKMLLEKVSRIVLFPMSNMYNCNDKRFEIFGDGKSLGVYSSKERALEILDEIQSKLDVFNKFINEPKDMFKNFFIPPVFVYEMPKE